MPLQIVRNDITKIECDAIVNAAKTSLLGGGGVDGAIHKAAGEGLLRACEKLGGCEVGQAKLTKGYNLPCKYVIHTVGPVWSGGNAHEKELLASCYRESLRLAKKHRCKTVAFPLISSGAYGYPKDEALQVATGEIGRFLLENDMTVLLVVFDKGSFALSKKLRDDITEYIDENYVESHFDPRREAARSVGRKAALPTAPMESMAPRPTMAPAATVSSKKLSLQDAVSQVDESFSEMLLRKIDEKGMKDSECYKKANISRKLFSKIRSDPHYRPSKPTAIAFAIALELPLDETKELLMKAGFALSRSNKFDIIIE